MNTEHVSTKELDLESLKKRAVFRVIVGFSMTGLVFFLTAGTIRYWEAWAYLITILIPMLIFGIYMFRHDPRFLERRMRTREKRKKQKWIMKIAVLPFVVMFFVPGFDRRWGWSDVPVAVKVIGLVLVLLGYLMMLYVFKVNSFASRVVDVEDGQHVITVGPYARVRHPMYSALIVFYGAAPLILGSYWALVSMVFLVPVLVLRILDEEKELLKNLRGYEEYTGQVKCRLLPGIW